MRLSQKHHGPRLIVALDFPHGEEALALARRLDPALCRLKVGKELFTRTGPGLIQGLQDMGYSVFLDLKYHDIPNTVAAACRAAADLGVWMVNVHALGGRRMLEAAVEALDQATHRPWLIAVTLLTSLDESDVAEIGLDAGIETTTRRLALLSRRAGLDGVVCSAREAPVLREACGAGFRLVTPGIRPAGARQDDQRRVMTPVDALSAGADYLVVGRPVTRAGDPAAALRNMAESIGET